MKTEKKARIKFSDVREIIIRSSGLAIRDVGSGDELMMDDVRVPTPEAVVDRVLSDCRKLGFLNSFKIEMGE